jgi:hypothetical protein
MRDAVAAQDAELILQWQECRVEGKTTTLAELCRDRPDLLPDIATAHQCPGTDG